MVSNIPESVEQQKVQDAILLVTSGLEPLNVYDFVSQCRKHFLQALEGEEAKVRAVKDASLLVVPVPAPYKITQAIPESDVWDRSHNDTAWLKFTPYAPKQ
jgi:hypothetical protein